MWISCKNICYCRLPTCRPCSNHPVRANVIKWNIRQVSIKLIVYFYPPLCHYQITWTCHWKTVSWFICRVSLLQLLFWLMLNKVSIVSDFLGIELGFHAYFLYPVDPIVIAEWASCVNTLVFVDDSIHNSTNIIIKIYGWWLLNGFIPCKGVVFHRHIGENSDCPICLSGSEDMKHMMFICDRAKSVWQSMPQLRLNSGIWGSSYDDRMAPYL